MTVFFVTVVCAVVMVLVVVCCFVTVPLRVVYEYGLVSVTCFVFLVTCCSVMVVVSPSTTVSTYPSAVFTRFLLFCFGAFLSSVEPSEGSECVPVSFRYGRSMGSEPPGFTSVHWRTTSHAKARQLRFSHRYDFLDVCPASMPNEPSCTRYRSSSNPIIDT